MIKRFWKINFDSRPKIEQKIIIPNLISILQFLNHYDGIAILPEYLLFRFPAKNNLVKLWEGKNPTFNLFPIPVLWAIFADA
jgi:hypothetical protein